MSFILAHLSGARVPRTVQKPVATGSAFEKGALLVVDANGKYAECAADPTAIAAVAESAYGVDDSGFNPLGRHEFPTGEMQGTSVQDERVFHADYLGALPAAAGGNYGVTRDTDGRWKVDFAKNGTGTAPPPQQVKLVSIEWTRSPLNKPKVLISVLPSFVQII